ncbi:MAG: hypothetical protein J4F28_08680 [Nitrosopumilaceae archaeon]|nr:hypothetical protein [Nitrosopumilaceae archaeon]
MGKEDWKTVNVKKRLLDEVERIQRTDEAKKAGITNVAQFVDLALREKLEKFERRRFEHINMHEDHVKILDNKLERAGRIVSVYFRDTKAWCEYCDEHMCVHIQYAWEIPDVREILSARKLAPPPSRVF